MLIPIRLAPPSPSSSSSSASAAAAAVTPAKAGQGTLFSQTQQQHHPEEWSLIELNGTLSASVTGGSSGNSSSNAAGAVSLGGLPLGQLSFAAPEKVG